MFFHVLKIENRLSGGVGLRASSRSLSHSGNGNPVSEELIFLALSSGAGGAETPGSTEGGLL